VGALPGFRMSYCASCLAYSLNPTPESWWRDHHKPAVKFLRAEELPPSRSDFLVLRHPGFCADTDLGAKIMLRSMFDGGKPYHFYLVGDQKDRVFCSELVATIYAEAGKHLVPNKDCRHNLAVRHRGDPRKRLGGCH
jgi:hypothetical protein